MTIQQNVLDISGKKVATKKLSEAVFGTLASPQLLALAARVYLSNQRQGTKRVMSRSDVSLTKKKVWRQKGTGNARHGARSAPIFVGGGKAHGPTGNENYRLTLPKKMRKRALVGALSAKVAGNELALVDNLEKLAGKTKSAVAFLTSVTEKTPTQKVLIVLDSVNTKILSAFDNLPNVTTTQALRLNPYELMEHNQVIMSVAAADLLEERLDITHERDVKKQQIKTD